MFAFTDVLNGGHHADLFAIDVEKGCGGNADGNPCAVEALTDCFLARGYGTCERIFQKPAMLAQKFLRNDGVGSAQDIRFAKAEHFFAARIP